MYRIPSRTLLCALLALLMAAVIIPASSPLAVAAPAPAPSSGPSTEPAEPVETPEPPPAPGAEDRSEPLNNVVSALGTVQSFLEFYFMQTGQYPEALEDMLAQYNQTVKQGEPLVKIPTDPATGKKFIYNTSNERTRYVLRVPEPAAYGVTALSVHQVDWGWMAAVAADQKRKRQTAHCAQYMQLIAEMVDQYNKANRNRFPDRLDQLIPKYLQKLPACPLTKKAYAYAHTDRGFEIVCPDPKAHGFDEFKFNSTEGLKKFP